MKIRADYDSGFDGDMGNAYGGASYEEEERRRRREQQAQQQQQSPYQTPADDERRQPQYQNQSPAQQPQQQTQTQQRPQQDTRTFAQRQAAGEARPAPSAVTPYEHVATGEETRGMGLPPVLKQGAPVSGVTPGGIDPLRVAMPQVSIWNWALRRITSSSRSPPLAWLGRISVRALSPLGRSMIRSLRVASMR